MQLGGLKKIKTSTANQTARESQLDKRCSKNPQTVKPKMKTAVDFLTFGSLLRTYLCYQRTRFIQQSDKKASLPEGPVK